MTTDIIKKTDAVLSILDRPNKLEMQIFTPDKIKKIAAGMPEIHRATRVYGRKNTQTTNRLMTCTMLADADPYHVIRQCLSQIEHKRQTLKEHRFKLLKGRNRIKFYIEKLDKSEDPIEKEMWQIKIEEKESEANDMLYYIEGALKDLASFQATYQQVCKNNNIPEDWDEEDMERMEVKHHLRMAFLHAYRDLMAQGRLNYGTLEYLQQFGVHPQYAFNQINLYLQSLDGTEDYEHLESWLDKMVEKNKENHHQVLERIGLDQLYETWYQYKEADNEYTR